MNVEGSKLYNIEFNERTNYLYAYVSADKGSVEICRQYWHELAEECRRTKCSKLLIVKDIKEEVVSTTDIFQVASEIPNMGFPSTKIAFIDQHIENNVMNGFGETVAINRGANLKFFNSVEEAEKWL